LIISARADLSLRLLSPSGKSVLLSEDRGGTNSLGYGAGFGTNFVYTVFTEDRTKTQLPVKYSSGPFLPGVTDPGVSGRVLFDSFEDIPVATYFDQPMGNWKALGQVNVVADGTAFTGSRYVVLPVSATLSRSRIETNVNLIVGRSYSLNLAYRPSPAGPSL